MMTNSSSSSSSEPSSSSTPEVLSLSSHENDEDDHYDNNNNDDDNDDDGMIVDDNDNNNNGKSDIDDDDDDDDDDDRPSPSTCKGSSKTSIRSSSPLSTRIEKFLKLHGKFTEKSMYTERGIKLLQWTAWLISQLTKNNHRLHKELSPSFRKLYVDLSNMRYVLRLYGFPGSWAAVREGGRPWAGSPPYSNTSTNTNTNLISNSPSCNGNGNTSCWNDGRITTLANIMAWSMVIYHPLEHIAFANWTMPKLLTRIDGNKLSALSCRCWLVYIVADWAGSYLKNCELLDHREKLLSLLNVVSESESESKSQSKSKTNHHHDQNRDAKVAKEIEAIEKCMKLNRLQMLRNFFFFPSCLNWSLDKWATDPLLSENVVNGLSLAEAIVCMYQSVLTL